MNDYEKLKYIEAPADKKLKYLEETSLLNYKNRFPSVRRNGNVLLVNLTEEEKEIINRLGVRLETYIKYASEYCKEIKDE